MARAVVTDAASATMAHDATSQVEAPGTTLRHEPALDGLRGAAVAAVLLYHGGYLTGGYLGVDAFFVLSGFLITSLLIVEHGKRGGISLRAFWARRARRLLPAVLGVLVAVVIYAAFVAQQDELSGIRGDAFATLAYFANWRAIAVGGDYFSIFRSPSPLQHTWSLAIEEQFYILWPVAVLWLVRSCTPRRAQLRVLVMSCGLAVVSFALAQGLYTSANPSRVYYGTDTRASSILLGAALAAALMLLGPIREPLARRLLEVVGCVAAAWLGYEWVTLAGRSVFLYRGGFVLCAVAVGVVIAAAVNPQRGPIFFALSFAPLRALGAISYGLYLWHWPVFVYLSEDRTGLSGLQLLSVRLLATLGIALVSYHLIEQPIRRQRIPALAIWIGAPVLCAVLVVTLVMNTVTTSLPIQGRFITKVVPTPGTDDWRRILASYARKAALSPSSTRVLIAGDSIAESLGPNALDASRHVVSAPFGLIGCSIVDAEVVLQGFAQTQDVNCRSWPTLYTDMIDAFDPDVVVVMLGPWEMFDRQVHGVQVESGSQHLAGLIANELERQRRIVTMRGAKEILLSTPCFTPHQTADNEGEAWRDTKRLAWLNGVWKEFASAHPHDVLLADFGAFVCPGGQARRSSNGEVLRPDGLHFGAAGAATVWPWITDQVVALRDGGRLRRR